MKKTLFAIGLCLLMGSFAVAEDVPKAKSDKEIKEVKELPYCGAVEDIMELIKDKEGGTIVKLELQTDHWVVETVAADGSKRKYSINCRMEPSEKQKDASALKVPPQEGISLVDLTRKVKEEYKGEIKRIQFIEGKWVVCTMDGKVETTRVFDVGGKLVSTVTTN